MLLLRHQVVLIGQLPSWIGWWGGGFVGLLIYLSKCPEHWFPGKFDFLGSSHQFWHLVMLYSLASCVNVILALAASRRESLLPLVYQLL